MTTSRDLCGVAWARWCWAVCGAWWTKIQTNARWAQRLMWFFSAAALCFIVALALRQ
jgi:hypothetical protein